MTENTQPKKNRTAAGRKAEKRRKFLHALFKRKIVIVGAVGVLFFIFVAVFAPLLAPYDPNQASAPFSA